MGLRRRTNGDEGRRGRRGRGKIPNERREIYVQVEEERDSRGDRKNLEEEGGDGEKGHAG